MVTTTNANSPTSSASIARRRKESNEGDTNIGGSGGSNSIRAEQSNGNDQHAASAAAQSQWQEWVPMNPRLYDGTKLLRLCMLQKVDEMLTEADIPYWICGGTLLGAIRHGGFIPHDDDVDIECFEDDLERIAALPLDLPLYTGFEPSSGTWEGHKVGKFKFFDGRMEVDVFPRPADLPAGQRHFPSRDECLPLERYKFCNVEVWGPNQDKCGAYLDRCYGEGWRDFVAVWNHDFNWYHSRGFDEKKAVLPLERYNSVVTDAGIRPPEAEHTAAATYQRFNSNWAEEGGAEEFWEQYRKYRFERVWRRNRADAEYRYLHGDGNGNEPCREHFATTSNKNRSYREWQ